MIPAIHDQAGGTRLRRSANQFDDGDFGPAKQARIKIIPKLSTMTAKNEPQPATNAIKR
jgi:hypothetical protein